MPGGTAVFLDTSILIASLIHARPIKKSIEARLRFFDFVCSGLVARHEFKRRLLIDAKYLYEMSRQYDRISDIQRRLEYLPQKQRSKNRTCLQIINTIDEEDSDEDRLDRLRLLTLDLLRRGLRTIERLCHFDDRSGCACGKANITEKRRTFDFKPNRCSKTGNACKIDAFLTAKRRTMTQILRHLESIRPGAGPGQKSQQLQDAERFITEYLSNGESVQLKDPCKKFGDLLIALESEHIPNFYTINAKESQHLCRALGQTMFVRPPNPENPEVECPTDDADWPPF